VCLAWGGGGYLKGGEKSSKGKGGEGEELTKRIDISWELGKNPLITLSFHREKTNLKRKKEKRHENKGGGEHGVGWFRGRPEFPFENARGGTSVGYNPRKMERGARGVT